MNKWLMLVVLVLLVLTTAMGLKSFATPSWNAGVAISAPSVLVAGTSAPAPARPWKK